MIFAGYFGLVIIMFLYNLVIYLSTKDTSYLHYIFFILFVSMAQMTLEGYFFDIVSSLDINIKAYAFTVVILQAITGIFFFRQSKGMVHSKTVKNTLTAFICIFGLTLVFSFLKFYKFSYFMVNTFAGIAGIYVLVIIILNCRKNLKQGIIFVIAYTLYLTGIVLYTLKNMSILPFHPLTNYTMMIGSACELFLIGTYFGFQLNVLKEENAKNQAAIIQYLLHNEEVLKQSQELALKAEKLEREKILSEFETLKNQVNPHFLFNSLNVLTELVYENKDAANQFIEQLSEVYRYVLTTRNRDLISITEEIEFIKSFIYLHNIRFNNNIKTEFSLNIIRKGFLPPLSIQMLIENAVKHNIISDQYPLLIKIEANDDYVLVTNNIQPKINIEKSTGIGLKNISERISFLTKKDLIIEKKEACFTVKIPITFSHINYDLK